MIRAVGRWWAVLKLKTREHSPAGVAEGETAAQRKGGSTITCALALLTRVKDSANVVRWPDGANLPLYTQMLRADLVTNTKLIQRPPSVRERANRETFRTGMPRLFQHNGGHADLQKIEGILSLMLKQSKER